MNLKRPLELNFELDTKGADSEVKKSLTQAAHSNDKKQQYIEELEKSNQELKSDKAKLSKELEAEKVEAKNSSTKIKELEQKNEALATENLRLIAKNSDLIKQNKILADSVRRIEIQMDLLKELLQRD
ncbi:hypothetical protein [Idiomarina piscisalsi]|uniref:Uncharacterized protein n=1 Tax=Idiomarina piscisalsi TaxID=1096243 RepID=A0A432YRR7_9GAMM|nr:hypothetical protein [Idiomarina piscisalsi]RUO64304.1 hypothetical protein CWI73_09110 [Idiomarina piscisalsi]